MATLKVFILIVLVVYLISVFTTLSFTAPLILLTKSLTFAVGRCVFILIFMFVILLSFLIYEVIEHHL